MNTAITVAAVFVLFGAGVFVATYSLLAPWWRSQEGWNLMTFTSSVAGLALLRCLAAMFGEGFWGQNGLRLLLMGLIAAAAWHRWARMLKAQLANLHRDVAPRE